MNQMKLAPSILAGRAGVQCPQIDVFDTGCCFHTIILLLRLIIFFNNYTRHEQPSCFGLNIAVLPIQASNDALIVAIGT